MNEALNGLKTRRSCRKFQPRQVEEAVLDQILEAATYAPSGRNLQPTRLVVLQNPEDIALLERMNAAVLGAPEAHPFYGAPTVVLVLADPMVSYTWVEDGALVLGNLMLAAHALGVGSCWIHRARQEFASPEGKALLAKWGVPETFEGIGHCILGYPAEAPAAPAPRKENFIIKV